MNSFFLLIGLFLFHVALTSAIDVREMSIDEYINFVNPPAVYKYQNEYGQTILCVKFTDQISVKYSEDNVTRSLKKAPKLKPPTINIPKSDPGRANISKVRFVKPKCPEDTVATREIKREDVERAGSVKQFLNRGNRRRSRNHMIPNHDDGHIHEHSIVVLDSDDEPIYRLTASMNVWIPEVTPDASFSDSQFWISNGDDENLETIEFGWMVYPVKYRTAEPVLFVYWTSDNYYNGCYDLDCQGFVQTPGVDIVPGSEVLSPGSVYGGIQTEFPVMLSLHEEEDVGLVWALFVDDVNIGYWPASLFDAISEGAVELNVGGEVSHRVTQPSPMTQTQMGSGHFALEGYTHAAYTRAITVYNQSGHEFEPIEDLVVATKPRCYGALYVPSPDPHWGKNIYFGGPGGADNNPECVA